MCADLNLPLLGKVPLDPRIARSCDEGKSFLSEVPDSPAAEVYKRIVQSESAVHDQLSSPSKVVDFLTFLGTELECTPRRISFSSKVLFFFFDDGIV